jgi:hypothetical protein
VGEVASEGCSPSLWAGAESPVAGAVRLARSKLDNLRYLSGTESQRTFQIIYLKSEEKPPHAPPERRQPAPMRSVTRIVS